MVKVSIAITTYNLEDFISQALDSILNQETSFKYQILVADDCSTDNTTGILREYEAKYPDIVKVFYSDHNMGSLANSNRVLDHIEGEYFAFMDGDDYWIDKSKLQKQVDFLDQHIEYNMCTGNTYYLRNESDRELIIPIECTNQSYCFDDYLNNKMPFCHTSAILFRNVIFRNGLPKCYFESVGTYEECALRGEDFRRVLHLETAGIYVMKDCFSVYRIHDKGLWQGSSLTKRLIECAISTLFYYNYFASQTTDFFACQAKSSYKSLIHHLIVDKDFAKELPLSKEEKFLLGQYINNYPFGEISTIQSRQNKLKRYLKNILFIIVRKISI